MFMFETPSDTSSDFENPLTRVSVVKPARRTPLPNPGVGAVDAPGGEDPRPNPRPNPESRDLLVGV